MLECKPYKTLCNPHNALISMKQDGTLLSDSSSYHSLVGALQCTSPLPNLILRFLLIGSISLCMPPIDIHFAIVKLILHYLEGSIDYGILVLFKPGPITYLSAYADADGIGDLFDSNSTSGFIVFLGSKSNHITWLAKKKSTISRHFNDAEYHSLASTVAKLYWLCIILKDLGVFLHHMPQIWCDNIWLLTLPIILSFILTSNILKFIFILFENVSPTKI